jgi:transcriptional regulator with XRE-family HTH domain
MRQRLAGLMKGHGKSIPTLAAELGIQESTLQIFLDGHRSLPGDVLDALAEQLGTSPDFLVGRSSDPRPVSEIRGGPNQQQPNREGA